MRPRLVEEGKPIPQHISEDEHKKHVALLDNEYIKAINAGENCGGSTNTNKSSLSSLIDQRKNQTSSKSDYKVNTSIVIGYDKSLKTSSKPEIYDNNLNSFTNDNHYSDNRNVTLTSSNCYKLRTSLQIGSQNESIPKRYDEDNIMDVDGHEVDDFTSNDTDESHHKKHMNHSISINNSLAKDNLHIPIRMELDDSLAKSPLVVIDGANVAYAYAQVMNDHSSLAAMATKRTLEPHVRGIQIASNYFINGGCRVQIVIPAYWLRRKPRQGDNASDNAMMMTEQVEILQQLQSQNLLVCSPPTDDDDAYAIAIARREYTRAQMRHNNYLSSISNMSTTTEVMSISGAFVLSNDLFRDAIQRDESGDLKSWLNGNDNITSGSKLPGRISYSFCDVGCMDLDFIANPR